MPGRWQFWGCLEMGLQQVEFLNRPLISIFDPHLSPPIVIVATKRVACNLLPAGVTGMSIDKEHDCLLAIKKVEDKIRNDTKK